MLERTVPAELAAEYGLRFAGELKAAAEPSAPAPASSRHTLPVTPDLSGLLPYGGLSTVTALPAARTGATSLLWRLLAGPSQAGAWCAVVGLPGLYPLAARSAGVDLDRLALVEADRGQVPDAAGALAAGVPVLVVPSAGFTPKQMRRLAAKSHRSGTAIVWWETRAVDAADARLEVAAVHWQGLRAGSGRRYGTGRLTGCELEVAARWRAGGKHRARIRPYGGVPPGNVVDLGLRTRG
ncbi:hypothetical protein [Glycomyces xiaoerkulensis]|uniref:hypothetical protein n=1 Tax=Glycomyces xiaoerkulensis TaxID=2038139 RepID=UPI00130009BD|nr:hypothetical protein [Glycomyces xiaoerkulensis]